MDQAKQTKETAPAALPAPVATGQRDLFVYFTLVLVAAALGFGLNLHFDASFDAFSS